MSTHINLARAAACALLATCLAVSFSTPVHAASYSGAIWTTDDQGGVNINIFSSKQDVYLNGGPVKQGAAGLPDGWYCVQVTEPNGTLLGTSTNLPAVQGGPKPVQVVDGEFVQVYKLWDILVKASDGTQGYDDTSNAGGEYKVWASQNCAFPNDESKTDNFKVEVEPPPGEYPIIEVEKFYDANVNGELDPGEVLLDGWKISIVDGMSLVKYTPVYVIVITGDYTVCEFQPLECHWMPTTPVCTNISLGFGDVAMVEFGNVCLGPGGAKTIGFWGNKNGAKLINGTDLAMLSSLNLVDEFGDDFDPPTFRKFKMWLREATAVNMAYMLSAQLAAMELNVFNGEVDGNALIYAPGTTSANALGFATVYDVMAEANTELGLHPLTLSGSPYRAYQEALKNALDRANNNLSFVQPYPCPYTFVD